jgi:hypothetical protein
MNFIKICPEIALKYFFEKMWFYMKYIYIKKSKVTNTYVHGLIDQKISACLEMNFIKICPEIALKYFFEKMWFYMKYILKNQR